MKSTTSFILEQKAKQDVQDLQGRDKKFELGLGLTGKIDLPL